VLTFVGKRVCEMSRVEMYVVGQGVSEHELWGWWMVVMMMQHRAVIAQGGPPTYQESLCRIGIPTFHLAANIRYLPVVIHGSHY